MLCCSHRNPICDAHAGMHAISQHTHTAFIALHMRIRMCDCARRGVLHWSGFVWKIAAFVDELVRLSQTYANAQAAISTVAKTNGFRAPIVQCYKCRCCERRCFCSLLIACCVCQLPSVLLFVFYWDRFVRHVRAFNT